jgi:phospholipid/cholesterol/gamma-HCH transport system substrate-binding protein
MKFRIRHADRIVGLFVVLAGFALLGTIAMAGASQRWFAVDYRYVTMLGSAAAASPGTGIFMRGFQVGKIEKVALENETQVRATFVIYDSYHALVRANSIIEIVTSPIGLGTQILFHPGKGDGLLPELSILPEASSPEGQALIEAELVDMPKKDDTITRLLAGVNPLIENINKTVVSLNKTLGEVNKALAGEGSGPVARMLDQAAGAVTGVNGLVGNANKAIVDINANVSGISGTANKAIGGISDNVSGLIARVDNLASDLNRITANLATMSESLKDPTGLVPKLLAPQGSIKTLLDDDNKLFDQISRSLADVERAISGISRLSSSLAAEMPGISSTILEVKNTLKESQDVIQGLKNNALIKGGIPQRAAEPAVFQSLREGLF